MYKNNILETIGNTPLVKLNKIVSDIPALILGKIETFNPGNSIKDRMALKMVDDAEHAGLLRKGGTIIECTSGNTGMGLALAGAVRGYRCIFTTNDKQSKAKIDILRAVGAEVIVCPTNVDSHDPRSYYSVAERLSNEIPNSWWANQYENDSNQQAHYESTGPEIWEQTEGKITHLVAGVGTGGTISGTARYLKEKNPNIQVWGIDPYGSALKKAHETGIVDPTEVYPYLTEGIGKECVPGNVRMEFIDHFEKVDDKTSAVLTRRLAREEGLLLGFSAGTALGGLLQLKSRLKKSDVVVIIFHDHGSRYLAKIFNDDWMRERGFLDDELQVKDLIQRKMDKTFFSVQISDTVRQAFGMMKDHEISQMPVMKGGEIVGSITENAVLSYMLENPLNNTEKSIESIMDKPFPLVNFDLPYRQLSHYISRKVPAVLTRDQTGVLHILTQFDIIKAV